MFTKNLKCDYSNTLRVIILDSILVTIFSIPMVLDLFFIRPFNIRYEINFCITLIYFISILCILINTLNVLFGAHRYYSAELVLNILHIILRISEIILFSLLSFFILILTF